MKLQNFFVVALLLLFAPAAMADNFLAGETVSLSATTSSSRAQFTLSDSSTFPDVLVYNAGSVVAFIGCGGSSVAAVVPAVGTKNATPVPPGAIMVLRKGSATYCAGITSSSTATLYFSAGIGE